MKVMLFGASGMVGRGVLRECLLDPGVSDVLVVGRGLLGERHAKLRELICLDMFDLSAVSAQLQGFDACFFCLGVSSAGLSEAEYRRLSFELTLSVARMLVPLNPSMTFTYVSGAGTDSSERGRVMWARVKGATENALLGLPFRAAYMFRPGMIRPLHGVRSKTPSYRLFYLLAAPLLPLLQKLLPSQVTTTEQMGRAMLKVARAGAPRRVLESADINAL